MGMYVVRLFCPHCDEWRETKESRKNIANPVRSCSRHRLVHRRVTEGARHLDANGYERQRIDGKVQYVHRIVWEREHGPIPDGYHVHHKNEVRHDNRLENLELVDGRRHNRDHTRERHADGRLFAKGEASKRWRVDMDDEHIARRYREGASLRQIGREVGASHNVVTSHLRNLGLR